MASFCRSLLLERVTKSFALLAKMWKVFATKIYFFAKLARTHVPNRDQRNQLSPSKPSLWGNHVLPWTRTRTVFRPPRKTTRGKRKQIKVCFPRHLTKCFRYWLFAEEAFLLFSPLFGGGGYFKTWPFFRGRASDDFPTKSLRRRAKWRNQYPETGPFWECPAMIELGDFSTRKI